jgi:excinuclease ABC subunit A
VKGGRCEACQGDGVTKVEMHFLPDIYVACDVCHGKRYNRETLDIRYRARNIQEVLEMTAAQAAEFFSAVPAISRKLQTLIDVGLGYVRLGQSATTLSGGEAQRVKLSLELSKRDTGRTLYILDEPTTGLHFHDIQLLLNVLQRLRDAGNTVVVIEHNLDVVKTADWIIDLGPEGGDGGGRIVAAGTPEKIAATKESYTGRYLATVLGMASRKKIAA